MSWSGGGAGGPEPTSDPGGPAVGRATAHLQRRQKEEQLLAAGGEIVLQPLKAEWSEQQTDQSDDWQCPAHLRLLQLLLLLI